MIEQQQNFLKSYRQEFGYVLPTNEVMDRLVSILHQESGPNCRVLDAGSGSGFLAKELCRLGVNTFAVDRTDYENTDHSNEKTVGYPIKTVFQRDALGNAIDYVTNDFDAVLLVWPPYDQPFALDIAQAMSPGQLLIYEGEGKGGCNADEKFFEYVSNGDRWIPLYSLSEQLNEVHMTFDGLHDKWRVWRKNTT